jgi:DNA-binding CsgD family transcriptional regulator
MTIDHHRSLDPGGIPRDSRHLAVSRDATLGASFELANLWHRLHTGRWRLCDTFECDGRYYAVVEQRPGNRRGLLRCVGLSIMEQILLGQSAKVVAIERNVTPSAVTSAVKSALRHIGANGKLRATPHVLVMAVRAARSPQCRALVGRIAPLADGSPRTFVVSMPRPRFELLDELSRCEREVMVALIEGASYAEIAEERHTSRRTIANQASVGFRKLRVSGRGEALERLMARALDCNPGDATQIADRAAPTLTTSGVTAPNGFSQSGFGRRSGVALAPGGDWPAGGLGSGPAAADVTALTGLVRAREAAAPPGLAVGT